MMSSENPNQPLMDPFEDVEWHVARSILARHGFEPHSRETISEQETRGRLWELIYAMAARRFYLSCTDHLSDDELHHWLHKNWLDEATADLPPEAALDTRISPVCECGEEEGTLIWIRYYADEEERRLLAKKYAAEAIPPHEDPQHDRDRFLPGPPLQLDEMSELECEEDGDEEALPYTADGEDLLGLKDVDAAIRASREEFEHDALDLNDEDECGDETVIEEWHRPMDLLHRQGVCLLPPDEHTDDTIGAGVWELLHELACLGFYVLHTDHLTDRDLYATLWRDILREPVMLPQYCDCEAAAYYDFISSGRKDAEQIRFRFYSTDEERAKACLEAPHLSLPPREKPVACRDWRLPKGPF